MRFRAFVVATAIGAWLAGIAGAQAPDAWKPVGLTRLPIRPG